MENNLTPEEKAQELVKKLIINYQGELLYFEAKQCALVCVQEIKRNMNALEKEYDEDFYHAYGTEYYWNQVEDEIKKL